MVATMAQKESRLTDEIGFIVCQSIGIPVELFAESRKIYMDGKSPHRKECISITKMNRLSMQKMRVALTGEELPKLAEMTKERSYELYQQKNDT